jgi:hypothetical protein
LTCIWTASPHLGHEGTLSASHRCRSNTARISSQVILTMPVRRRVEFKDEIMHFGVKAQRRRTTSRILLFFLFLVTATYLNQLTYTNSREWSAGRRVLNSRFLVGGLPFKKADCVKRIEGDTVSDIRHCDPQLQRDADSTSHTVFGLAVRERSGTAKGPDIGPGLPTAETF